MNTGTMQLVAWGLAGLAATLVMDIGGGVLRSTGLTHGAPPQLIGRFFLSVFRGHFTELDSSIPADASFSLGFVLPIHYAIGTALGLLFGFGVRLWDSPPPWWLPVLYGIGTTALPALWMFPAMGFGLFGLRGPTEFRLLSTALVNHLLFGIGLALAATLVVRRFR
jgi:hypothetical protein